MTTGSIRPLASPAGATFAGSAPVSAADAGGESVLLAATYSGGGRTVVKLIDEALLEAETLAQATVGLEPGPARPVARAPRRATGFPAWPIITDPANARHALNLVGDLEWARRNARNQATKVADRFDALVDDLTASAPHFVPTLLEELARIFAAAGNEKFARRHFGRAREVERAHGVAVDDGRHAAAFLEFARAGVVGAKELTQEANDAMARIGDPAEAFDYVLRINCARIRAGQAPYAYFGRDLRKVGKAAGLSAEQVDDLLFDGVVGLAAFHAAPPGFWKTVRPSLARWLRDRPERADSFVDAKPAEWAVEEWLGFLGECGAWDRLTADPEAYSSWTRKAIQSGDRWKLRETSPRFLTAIEDQIRGGGLRGMRAVPDGYGLAIDYVDALSAAGVEWRSRYSSTGFGGLPWEEWTKQGEHRRDLVAMLDDPELAEVIHDSLPTWLLGTSARVFAKLEGGRRLLKDRLDEVADALHDDAATLAMKSRTIDHCLRYFLDPVLETINPGAVARLRALDAAGALAAAIRAGVLAEMTVPGVEESASRLARDRDPAYVSVFDSYPALIIASGDRFEVIDDGRVTATGSIRTDVGKIMTAMTAGDDVALFLRHPGNWTPYVQWTNGTTTEIRGGALTTGGMTVEVPEGRITAGGLVGPGETSVSGNGVREIACTLDGAGHPDRLFARLGSDVREWDSATGTFAEEPVDVAKLPDILGLGPVPEGAKVTSCTAYPVHPATAASPAGSVDGRHVAVGHRFGDWGDRGVTTPLGVFRAEGSIDTVIRRPGGGHWLVSGSMSLRDAESGAWLPRRNGVLDRLPASAVHRLRPRSAWISETMRSFTGEAAAELLGAMSPEPDRGVDCSGVPNERNWSGAPWRRREKRSFGPSANARPGTGAWRVAARLLGTEDPVLLAAVIELAADAMVLGRDFRELVPGDATGATDASGGSEADECFALSVPAAQLLAELSGARYVGERTKEMPTALRRIAGELAERGSSAGGVRDRTDGVVRFIGHERSLLALLAAPALDPALVREITGMLRELVAAGVLCSGWRARIEDAPRDDKRIDAEWRGDEYYAELLMADDGRVWCVLSRDGSGDGEAETGGTADTDGAADAMETGDFLVGLDALDARAECGPDAEAPDLSRPAAVLAEATALSEAAATILIGGIATRARGEGTDHEARLEAHREALGLKVRAFKKAHAEVRDMPWDVIRAMALAGLPGGDVVRALTEGQDAAAMAEAWRRETGDLGFRLSDAEVTAIKRSLRDHGDRILAELLHPLRFGETGPGLRPGPPRADDYMAPLLTLASLRPAGDPIRPFLREQFRAVRAFIEEYGLKHLYGAHKDSELGGDWADVENHAKRQVHRVLTEGVLDELLADLERDPATAASAGAGTDGHPMDPLASAPDAVAAARAELGVDEDSARYFLQILALAVPTDANIRAWNGWRTKDIDAAAAPLVDKGLLVAGSRTGAGRTRFLSGGWLEPAPREKGLEVWKAPLYLLWRDAKMRPVVPTCPPLVPMPQLFADAWARYDSGDVPGYEELTTTRYRRR